MDKGAIKTFAIEARKILMKSAATQAGFYGVTKEGCADPIQKGTGFEVYRTIAGTENRIYGNDINKRRKLKEAVERQGFDQVIEATAYTWFNRLIAIRFMEVNGFLPTRTRVLSSETGSGTPDIVNQYMDIDLEMSEEELVSVQAYIKDNHYDDAFALLFVKQCNALNHILPKLFESTDDYMELLLRISYTNDGVVRKLVDDIPEQNFDLNEGGQIEVIGWLYQYYISEKHQSVVDISNKGPVKKEDIPAATQLFTTDWVVHYIVDNSLGRYWVERNVDSDLKYELDFLNSNEVFADRSLDKKNPEEITFFDPCIGSGHFAIYAFDIFMKIYTECGYSERDAAASIIRNNIYGLDIDERAVQLAYFSLMMKARQFDRRFFARSIQPNVYSIKESDDISGHTIDYFAGSDNVLKRQIQTVLGELKNAKNNGSIIQVSLNDWGKIKNRLDEIEDEIHLEKEVVRNQLKPLLDVAELLSRKYTIVDTNPPYLNKYNDDLKDYVNLNYKDYSSDLFSVFIYRNLLYTATDGYAGFMTPFVWMYIKSYEKLRQFVVENKSITTLVQMEYSAYEEATVPICSFVLSSNKDANIGQYFDLSQFVGGMSVQREKVLAAIKDNTLTYFHWFDKRNYKRIEGMPLAFMASERLLSIFETADQLRTIAEPRVGLQTGNNDQFLRLWHEIDRHNIGFEMNSLSTAQNSGKKWFPYNKGGDFRRWYGNRNYVVDWQDDGYAIKHCFNDVGKLRSRPQNVSYYFKPSITWSDITSASFSGRYCEGGFIFDVKGSSGFPKVDNLLYVLGFLNSHISQKCIKILNPTITTQVGDMARIPIYFDAEKKPEIDKLVEECIEISKADWDSFETSWDFQKHPLLMKKTRLSECFKEWNHICEQRFEQLKEKEEQLNRSFIEIYGLQNEISPDVDMRSVEASTRHADVVREIKSLISFAVGCMFGRYSLDREGIMFAGDAWNNDLYTSFKPDDDNCIPITDEAYFSDDIVGRFCEFMKVAFGEENLDENLDFIAKTLGNKGNTSVEVIRNYFLNDFVKDHYATYSITGSGKRPIYWLFDSGKQNGFKCLIYMHRYDKDTVGRVRSDYLRKAQEAIEGALKNAEYTIANSTSAVDKAAATKKREKYIKQLNETRTYFQALSHVALQRIEIDLDDGVKTNYAKFQGIEIVDEHGKKQKIDLLAKI